MCLPPCVAAAGAVNPVPYVYGSRGPTEADTFASKQGFEYSMRYQWTEPSKSRTNSFAGKL